MDECKPVPVTCDTASATCARVVCLRTVSAVAVPACTSTATV